MTDIVERIEYALGRDTFWDTDAPPLLNDAVAEIKRLRNQATCPHVRGTVTQHCSLNFTLTAEELEAIKAAIAYLQPVGNYDSRVQTTLRSLLERLQ